MVMMRFNMRLTSILMWCALVLLVTRAASSPLSSKIFSEHTTCHMDDELMDLCQRCAKLTKSPEALPLCCSSSDIKARRWCRDFVYFGRDDRHDFNS